MNNAGPPPTMAVTIANMKVQVPLYVDESTTQSIAERVSERVRAIEGRYGRIDNLGFALRAAFEFAAELNEAEEAAEDDGRELRTALSAIATRLQELRTEFSDAE
jgi:hypothetical protein